MDSSLDWNPWGYRQLRQIEVTHELEHTLSVYYVSIHSLHHSLTGHQWSSHAAEFTGQEAG